MAASTVPALCSCSSSRTERRLSSSAFFSMASPSPCLHVKNPAHLLTLGFSLTAPSSSLSWRHKGFKIQCALTEQKAKQEPMRVMISGAPASGKGTQCEYIVAKYGLLHISTGDLLRAEVAAATENGLRAKDYMRKGQLVPDEIVIQMVKDKLSEAASQGKGWLLDGFPRTSSQADALEALGIKPDTFVVLDVPEEVLIERVVGRRLDPVTGKIYHLKYTPPENEEIAARLTQRFDDTEPKAQEEEEEEEGKEEKEDGQSDEGAFEAEVLDESKGSYPDMAAFLEEAFKDDREVQEIIEKSFEDPEEMGKRVNERVKKKKKDILQPKTGSAVPMKVSFSNFDATDSYIWMELYNSPSEKDIDIIGSVIRSWYLLGCLGGYNSLNMQLTRVPVNERLSYNENVEDEIMPARFNNIGELEFQHNWGRFWVDLGTSDPLALDGLVNSFIAVSSDYVGIKELTFGGKDTGRWNEDITSEEDGYLSFKI